MDYCGTKQWSDHSDRPWNRPTNLRIFQPQTVKMPELEFKQLLPFKMPKPAPDGSEIAY